MEAGGKIGQKTYNLNVTKKLQENLLEQFTVE